MYNQVGFSLTDGQIAKLQNAKKHGKAVTLLLKLKQSDGKHDLYLTNTQVKKLEKGAARITFSKTQMKAQKGGFLGALLGIATKILPKVLPILGTLGLSAASGAISGVTHKAAGGGLKRSGAGTIPLYVNRRDVNKILNSVEKLEGGGIVSAGTCDACMKSIQEQKGGFIGTLLAGLAGPLLAGLFGGKGIKRAGKGIKRAGSKKR